MFDRKKAIKELEWILEDDRFGFGINWETGEPRDEYEKAGKIITDVITLLKEEKAVPPRKESYETLRKWASWGYACGACGREIDYHDRFCRHCGQKVNWNV